MPASFVYGQITLAFKVEDKVEKATFKYKYTASDNLVEYTDVLYSDPKLESMIEGNLTMMQKVDEYVRMQLSRKNQGLS